MRIRTVKPEFWRSADTAQLSYFARLLFIGLWNYVDDNGVGDDDADLIRSDLFPREHDFGKLTQLINGALTELSLRTQIVRYEDSLSGRRYLAIVNWHHQRINRPSQSSKPVLTSDNSEILHLLSEDSLNTHDGLTEGSTPRARARYQGTKGSRYQGIKGSGESEGCANRETQTAAKPGTETASAAPIAAMRKPDTYRGTRLPEDWAPSDDVKTDLRAKYPTLNLGLILEEFRDHWCSVPGQAGRKIDWTRTFRNRVRAVTLDRRYQHANANANGQTSTIDDKVNAWMNMPIPTTDDLKELECPE